MLRLMVASRWLISSSFFSSCSCMAVSDDRLM
jgi:hypothetical protein